LENYGIIEIYILFFKGVKITFMDKRDKFHLKDRIERILNQIAAQHYPSYQLNFVFVWHWTGLKGLHELKITPHAHDHKHFWISKDVLQTFVNEFKSYNGNPELSSIIKDISYTKNHITMLLTLL